jgi:hypothetical protein
VTDVTPIAIADEARLTEVRVELESLAASLAAEWATDVTALATIQGTGGRRIGEGSGRLCGYASQRHARWPRRTTSAKDRSGLEPR